MMLTVVRPSPRSCCGLGRAVSTHEEDLQHRVRGGSTAGWSAGLPSAAGCPPARLDQGQGVGPVTIAGLADPPVFPGEGHLDPEPVPLRNAYRDAGVGEAAPLPPDGEGGVETVLAWLVVLLLPSGVASGAETEGEAGRCPTGQVADGPEDLSGPPALAEPADVHVAPGPHDGPGVDLQLGPVVVPQGDLPDRGQGGVGHRPDDLPLHLVTEGDQPEAVSVSDHAVGDRLDLVGDDQGMGGGPGRHGEEEAKERGPHHAQEVSWNPASLASHAAHPLPVLPAVGKYRERAPEATIGQGGTPPGPRALGRQDNKLTVGWEVDEGALERW